MAEQMQILKWLLEVDRDATVEAYAQPWAYTCTCSYCQNFREALNQLPNEFLDLCTILGIDASKPSEVSELTRIDERPDIHLYTGFYHVVGSILAGPDNETVGGRTMIQTARLTDDYNIHFSNREQLVPAAFPRPVFALEFSGTLPWLLVEQP
jgi:hypothetical protein